MQNEKCKMQNREADRTDFSRRNFLIKAAATGLAAGSGIDLISGRVGAAEALGKSSELVQRIKDAEIRAGVEAAIHKNILPAAVETAYPGHFQITADGTTYGGDATWPGLDSWQMAGAYLLLGRSRLVVDYFDYVRA